MNNLSPRRRGWLTRTFVGASMALVCLASRPAPGGEAATAVKTQTHIPHVVFVTGDEEYRSEESMPMLAKMLHRNFGFKVTVCYSLAKNGTIDPNNVENVTGLEAVDDADLLVLFTRFRKLPDDQLRHVVQFAETGKPMVGFRTATHAFRYGSGPHSATMDEAWPIKVFGQRWITHHGHFGDGNELLTEVTINPEFKDHPILRGVEPFQAYSWLYHVEGGGDHLSGDCQRLLVGKAKRSSHLQELSRYPTTNPVAWTKASSGRDGLPARVFFTTLGHPYDFKQESMRKLAQERHPLGPGNGGQDPARWSQGARL